MSNEVPRTRVRNRPAQPTASPALVSAIKRHAAPPKPPEPRTRTRSQAVAPVPVQHVHGMASGLVEVEHKTPDGGHTLKQDRVTAPRRLPDGTFTPAMVRVSGGVTVSPRAYESIRIGVDVTLPCYPDADGLEGAYQEALTFVTDKVQQQIDENTNT